MHGFVIMDGEASRSRRRCAATWQALGSKHR
jgi:hypothetical protein